MARQRTNFVRGTLSSQLLTAGTAMNSAGLADLETIINPNVAIVVLDPLAVDGDPEIAYVTVHTAGMNTATLTRGEEGTVARDHAAGTVWKHAPVEEDFVEASPAVLFARKTADESVTSSTVLQDDDHLFLAVEADAVYEVTFNFIFMADPTGDLRLQFEVPAGATLDLGSARLGLSAAATSDDITHHMVAGFPFSSGSYDPGTAACAFGQGLLVVGGTAGTFKLTWAQWASSGVATTLKTNSYICLRAVS